MQQPEGLTDSGRDQSMSTGERWRMDRPHLLVINGSTVFLELMRELFADEQFNVTTTNYVDRTFDMISATQPDIVLIDLVVHQRAGWDLLRRLREELGTAGIPVLVTSTDPRLLSTVRTHPEEYGLASTVAMPMDVNAVVDQVRTMINAARRDGDPAPAE